MNIVVCADNRYILPCRVMLTSLCMHNEERMTIYLLHSEITKENMELIRKTVSGYGHVLKPCQVSEGMFEGAPLLPYISKTTYYRLLCAQLLPESAERALYLDVDLLVRGSVSAFYHSDFEGKLIIGIRDAWADEFWLKRLGLKGSPPLYINGGVLLLNLTLLRERMDLSEAMKILENLPTKLLFPDQDIINLYFQGEIKCGEENYNTQVPCVSAVDGYLKQFYPCDTPCILHFIGPEKPWHRNYYGKYFWEYDRYLLKVARGRQYRFWRMRYGRVFVMLVKRVMRK